jgi:hypothetical protein
MRGFGFAVNAQVELMKGDSEGLGDSPDSFA